MLCFSDGFLQLLQIFSDCGVACCMSSMERHPGKSASGAVRFRLFLILRGAPAFPGQRTAWCGTVNVPYIRWQCAPLLWAGIFRRDPSAREFGRKRRAF